ncbi:MAG: hypothetical protein NWF07_06635 [Candidatus Bathyarchaeota archaeon]|nr:hypothetical protein [Candidatus Bathyarchaeota archaeon]
MRDGLLVSAFLLISGVLIFNASADYPSKIISSDGTPVYICETIEDLYSESNLVIRGKPENIEIYYQNTAGATYQIEVLEVLKGTCEEFIEVSTANKGFLNKHSPTLSEEEFEQCEVILFLSKNKLETRVIDVNRGFFVVQNDVVYSIGVIDGDYSSLTNGLHDPYTLDDFNIGGN